MNAVEHDEVKGEKGTHIKLRSQIHSPAPSLRLVFIDEGWMTPDALAVYFRTEAWWDDPPVRHGDGANVWCLPTATPSTGNGRAPTRSSTPEIWSWGTAAPAGHPIAR